MFVDSAGKLKKRVVNDLSQSLSPILNLLLRLRLCIFSVFKAKSSIFSVFRAESSGEFGAESGAESRAGFRGGGKGDVFKVGFKSKSSRFKSSGEGGAEKKVGGLSLEFEDETFKEDEISLRSRSKAGTTLHDKTLKPQDRKRLSKLFVGKSLYSRNQDSAAKLCLKGNVAATELYVASLETPSLWPPP